MPPSQDAKTTKVLPSRASALLSDFGTAVRRVRRAQGRSQQEIADAAGVHRTYLVQVENGQRNITIGLAEGIANALDVDLLDLLSGG